MSPLQTPDGHRPARLFALGMRRWKQAHLAPMLSMLCDRLHFADTPDQVRALNPGPADVLLCWGACPPPELHALSQQCGARLVRMEDGFIRSVGLGSDLIPPHSVVIDAEGMYFDPSRPSALERCLSQSVFTPEELAEAAHVRAFIVQHGLTKYNHEVRQPPAWPSQGRRVVLVVGQVEDDASIRLGCTGVNTNEGLLQAARQLQPQAFIVYKPHPDVTSGNRKGALPESLARRWADHVETRCSVISAIEACDELHTLTSLAGFDALLRGRRVVTHGQPFYAGWGLTDDRAPQATALARRQRKLTLDELVAGTLLRHPLYWDWTLHGFTHCMAVLEQLRARRDRLAAQGQLARLQNGWLGRQRRKLHALYSAWTGRPLRIPGEGPHTP